MAELTDLEAPPPAEVDPTVPTLAAAMLRLRIDDDLSADVQSAIPEAKAEAESFLDGTLYATEQARAAVQDCTGIVIKPDIIAAQLLLIDAVVGRNSDESADLKRQRAFSMLRRHRNMGA